MGKVKLDIGSGPGNFWFWSKDDGDTVLRLDRVPFEGVIRWECPDPLPVEDKVTDEAFIGGMLIELDTQQQLSLADELNRVMKDDGVIWMRVYGGSLGFPRFFKKLRELGWWVVKEEMNNIVREGNTLVTDYFVEIRKV
ncbi:hypothetical protein DRN74_06490 [Candidatus Micrarchaeota archaeon]|nr:MAG: hypothetical protein DRN74_06490 [Candidatus Micrarchaeota archaeon]